MNDRAEMLGIEIVNGTIKCPECRTVMNDGQSNCPQCKWENALVSDGAFTKHLERQSELEILSEKTRATDLERQAELDGLSKLARSTGDWSGLPSSAISVAAKGIILTTAYSVANREIEREIEILSAECVYGMNIFRDFFAGVRDIFGGRSVATQKVLRDARKTCLTELKREALMVGADAVIAVDLDYSELSGGGKNGMLLLVATGTAVKLKTIDS